MKAIPNRPRFIIIYRRSPIGATAVLTLTTAQDETVDFTGRAQRQLVEYMIPEAYTTEENFPMTALLKVNGVTVRTVEITEGVLPASPNAPGEGSYIIDYDAGWPVRPATTGAVTWRGGTPLTPPPGLGGTDIWLVPVGSDTI